MTAKTCTILTNLRVSKVRGLELGAHVDAQSLVTSFM